MDHLVLTVFAPDKPGQVERIAQCIAEHGGNWLESRMARLAGQFAGIVRIECPCASADALLLAPVSYTPLTQEEAYYHVAAVAGSTSLPLCIYNNPSTTHFTFGEELLVRRLVAENPVQEEVANCGRALPTRDRIVDRLRGVEDRAPPPARQPAGRGHA